MAPSLHPLALLLAFAVANALAFTPVTNPNFNGQMSSLSRNIPRKGLSKLRDSSSSQGQAPKPPLWPPRFQIDFHEENYFVFYTLATIGTYFYEFDQGRVRVDRADGRGDRYCGSIFPGVDTPCTHLVLDGMRYLYFTQQDYCCKCCTASQGCGVLFPDWLANATYLGHDYIFGTLTTKWNMPGLQNNYYWQSMDDEPVRIYQEPITQMTFTRGSYAVNPPFSADVFVLPNNLDCSPQCGGLCSLL